MQQELTLFKKKKYSSFEVDSNFQTPLKVCEYMVSLVPEGVQNVFEPTPGLGNIVSVLVKNNYKVITADDFFLYPKSENFDCIVMNPPFSSKSAYTENAPISAETKGMKLGYYILKECMQMSNNVIALMPWYTISDSDLRLRFLKNFGIKSLTSLPRKTFEYARIQTVIIELEKGFKGETAFKIFDY